MTNKSLTLSIVIPVFNEEDYIGACLDSIAGQTELPNEVIIVDNNCTDGTVNIALSYPSVRVVKEKKQHQSYAQKTGFNAALTDIIGRIDADTILPEDWIKNVKAAFLADQELQAVTGSGKPYDLYMKNISVAVFRSYNVLASLIAGRQILWGSNFAILNKTWRGVKNKVLQRDDIWEDYDLAFSLTGKVQFRKDLAVSASFRAVHESFAKQFPYQFRAIRTVYYHGSLPRTALMFVCWNSLFLIYPFIMLDNHVLRPLLRQRTTYRRAELINEPLD